jgi:DNA-binding response OmpR family regulator
MIKPTRAVPAVNGRQVGSEHQQQIGTIAPVVFVVDDDASTLHLLCDIAQDAGWDARGFTRLKEFRANLDSDAPPSLLILDDDLPDGSGGDLARDLRLDPRTADVPLLVCTAAHPIRQAEIGSWAPVVSKPFDVGEIERFLRNAAHGGGNGTHHRAAG